MPLLLTNQAAAAAAADVAGFHFVNTFSDGANCSGALLPLNGTSDDALYLSSYTNKSAFFSAVPADGDADYFYKVNESAYYAFLPGFNANCTWEPTDPHVWGTFNYVALSSLCTSISVILQMIVFLTTGAMADFWQREEALAHVLPHLRRAPNDGGLLFPDYEMWYVNCLLFIVSNLFMGASTVFYNAYLPMLTMADPEILDKAEDENADADDIARLLEVKSSKMSTFGFVYGFVGAVLALCVNFVIFLVVGTDYESTCLNVAIVGAWTLLFGMIAFAVMKRRPGPALPPGASYVRISITTSYHTLAVTYRELPQMTRFLVAYFIYSDGASTIGTAAAVFASVELNMGMNDVLIALLLVCLVAPLGCVFFFLLSKKGGVGSKQIIFINLFIFTCIPIYGMVGLQSQFEFYILSAVFGFVTGSLASFTRSLFSSMIPAGHEGEYFSFYELTDKGTAWLGPPCWALYRMRRAASAAAFLQWAFSSSLVACF